MRIRQHHNVMRHITFVYVPVRSALVRRIALDYAVRMRAPCLFAAILAPALFAGAGAGTFRTGTSLVLVNVSVLDSHDRPVTSLSQEQFRVLDNGREQPIRFLAHEDAPLSLAIVLDTSGSMRDKWSRALNMLAGFCENLAPGDELFLVTVERRPKLLTDYTSDCAEMQNGLLLTRRNRWCNRSAAW